MMANIYMMNHYIDIHLFMASLIIQSSEARKTSFIHPDGQHLIGLWIATLYFAPATSLFLITSFYLFRVFIFLCIIGLVLFIIFDVGNDKHRLIALVGVFAYIAICWFTSKAPDKVCLYCNMLVYFQGSR